MKYREVKTPVATGRTAHGRYALRTDCAFAPRLRQFIEDRQFASLDPETEKTIVYRRHRKFEFQLPFEPIDVIMKISWASPQYPWHRRLQLMLKQKFFEDYCETAFYGALSLEDLDIPTHKVLAFWTDRVATLETHSYLMYEKVVADGTIHDLMLTCRGEDAGPEDTKRYDSALLAMARLVARLHAAGLRHGDIADHNFLIRLGLPDDANDSPDTLYMIDTDCIHEAGSWLKCTHDIRDWRIIDLDSRRLHEVLREYMGTGYHARWWSLLKFYRSPWYRPLRSLRYILKGRPLKDPYHLND